MILKKPKLLSLQTPSQMQKRNKKEKQKRRKVCCKTKTNANKNTTLFAAEDTKSDAKFSLSLSLCPQDTNQHKKDYDKNNKIALF
jgi:hypothetical protein